MATVTLGNIKFNWKGPYNNSTAYVVDDVVSSGGSSYICILASTGNAVSNGTYWQQMSAAGTNGTDLTTTLTTQGDIVYRDGSGLARLGAGTSGYFLKTQGTGANPVWAEAGGGLVQTVYATNTTAYQQGGSTYGTGSNLLVSGSITPTATNNKIIIMAEADGSVFNSNSDGVSRDSFFQISRDISGGTSGTQIVETSQRMEEREAYYSQIKASVLTMDTTYNTTSQLTYHYQTKGEGGGWDTFWQQNNGASNMILMEVKV
jgi:hypothetical protein